MQQLSKVGVFVRVGRSARFQSRFVAISRSTMNHYLQYGAQIYNKREGRPSIVQGVYVPCYEATGMAIANAYEELPLYDFSNIETVVAYTHFAVEICQQFDFITQVLHINIEP